MHLDRIDERFTPFVDATRSPLARKMTPAEGQIFPKNQRNASFHAGVPPVRNFSDFAGETGMGQLGGIDQPNRRVKHKKLSVVSHLPSDTRVQHDIHKLAKTTLPRLLTPIRAVRHLL